MTNGRIILDGESAAAMAEAATKPLKPKNEAAVVTIQRRGSFDTVTALRELRKSGAPLYFRGENPPRNENAD